MGADVMATPIGPLSDYLVDLEKAAEQLAKTWRPESETMVTIRPRFASTMLGMKA